LETGDIFSGTPPSGTLFLPSDSVPLYISATQPTSYTWLFLFDVASDTLNLSFEPNFIPYEFSALWGCYNEDGELLEGEQGNELISIEDGEKHCFNVPLQQFFNFIPDAVIEVFLPEVPDPGDYRICVFYRLLTFRSYLSFLNQPALVAMWVIVGILLLFFIRNLMAG
jgi:hypothetical protein